jgi:23S rRNA pseudouridine2457 synthase
LLLTDNGRLQARISQPRSKVRKRYWAQVEGKASDEQLAVLTRGVTLKDGIARAVAARRLDTPDELWGRDPPIRYRKNVADSWIEITLSEGRNRQVRRMTAAVGLPTLRLIRSAIGPWTLAGLAPGESREIPDAEAWRELQ